LHSLSLRVLSNLIKVWMKFLLPLLFASLQNLFLNGKILQYLWKRWQSCNLDFVGVQLWFYNCNALLPIKRKHKYLVNFKDNQVCEKMLPLDIMPFYVVKYVFLPLKVYRDRCANFCFFKWFTKNSTPALWPLRK